MGRTNQVCSIPIPLITQRQGTGCECGEVDSPACGDPLAAWLHDDDWRSIAFQGKTVVSASGNAKITRQPGLNRRLVMSVIAPSHQGSVIFESDAVQGAC